MSTVRVYIKPFDSVGNYVTDFIDVSRDVEFQKMGSINRKIENDEFNVGIFKNNDLSLSLRNDHGKYSEANELDSIFLFKRAGSQVQVTWDVNDVENACGTSICEEIVLQDSEEVLFDGLLSDDSLETDIASQIAKFKVLGLESIFSQVEFPLSLASNGDSVSALLNLALNQTKITELMTFNIANINPALDVVVDDVSVFENQTVKEFLDDILLISNSVLYIEDRKIIVTDNEPNATPDPSITFYGQASQAGAENIQQIKGIRTGINKTFNYWTWDDTTLLARDLSSTETYGIRKKAIAFDGITSASTRQTILNTLRDQWAFPVRDFTLSTPLNFDRIMVKFFDKIQVDYPPIFFKFDDNPIAIYEIAIYDTDIYPLTQWSLVIDPSERYKILGIKIDLKRQLIQYKMRLI